MSGREKDDKNFTLTPMETPSPSTSSSEVDLEAAAGRKMIPEAVVYCELSRDAVVDPELPVINIVNMESTENGNFDSSAIVAAAAAVMFDVADPNIPQANTALTSSQHSSDGVVQVLGQQRQKQQSLPWRAEFVSATIYKRKGHKIGLQLAVDSSPDSTRSLSDDNVLRIAKFEPDGLLHKSPLRVGDLLVSINEEPCTNKTVEEVEEMLAKFNDKDQIITIICENKNGQANLVECMMEKPTPQESLGLTLKRYHGTLKIHRVEPDSLSSFTLLNVGDRVIAINAADCHNLDGATAAEIIYCSPRYVTLLTETQRTSGVVVARTDSFMDAIPSLSSSYVAPRRAKEILAARQRACLFISLLAALLIASFFVIALFS